MTDKNERSPAAIGRRLKMLRQVHDLSQIELCRRAGIAPNKYNAWELGKKGQAWKGLMPCAMSFI